MIRKLPANFIIFLKVLGLLMTRILSIVVVDSSFLGSRAGSSNDF